MQRGWWVVAAGLMLASTACAHRAATEVVSPADVPVRVEVTNNYALPVEVFARAGGTNQRLGLVHPGMSGHFVVPPALVGNSGVEFIVRPSVSGPQFRSGSMLLSPGAIVDLVVAQQLFSSVATIRP